MSPNTLFLRLEGPLQAWGDQQSKFVIRRTAEAPTKSGVIGLLCAALGVSRIDAPKGWLPKLAALRFGVRIDQPGVRWWDYHTVGAGMPMRTAEGGTKHGAMLTRREYLCDASFLVALQGEPGLIAGLEAAINAPRWTLYLGRKSCPPSRPLLEKPPTANHANLLSALKSVAWRPRCQGDSPPSSLDCLLDWEPPEEPAVAPPLRAAPQAPAGAGAGLKPGATDRDQSKPAEAPRDALVWYDVPVTFDPPSHEARFVIRQQLAVGTNDGAMAGGPTQRRTPAPERVRTDYDKSTWGKIRDRRLDDDYHLCVFCKSHAVTGQHISYRHAGKEDNLAALDNEEIMTERLKQVRSLCRLCHDAVTMIEYGLGMGLDRINPEEPRWRDLIAQKRAEIIKFRSLETRRRHLVAEEVE